MNKRVSITLAICALAGAIAIVGLLRAPYDTSTTAPTEASETAAHDGHGGGDGATAEPAATQPGTINIEGFAFSGITSAEPGQVITVTNLDSAPHTLTAVDGSFDTGNLNPGESVTLTLPSAPGTYDFFCQVHPSMTASLSIQP